MVPHSAVKTTHSFRIVCIHFTLTGPCFSPKRGFRRRSREYHQAEMQKNIRCVTGGHFVSLIFGDKYLENLAKVAPTAKHQIGIMSEPPANPLFFLQQVTKPGLRTRSTHSGLDPHVCARGTSPMFCRFNTFSQRACAFERYLGCQAKHAGHMFLIASNHASAKRFGFGGGGCVVTGSPSQTPCFLTRRHFFPDVVRCEEERRVAVCMYPIHTMRYVPQSRREQFNGRQK